MNIRNKIKGLREIWQFDNRWELIGDRLFRPSKPCNIYRIKGLKILVDHSAGDANGAREVLTSDMYRQFLPQIETSQPLNILDIGANNGGFPLLLKVEGIPVRKLVCVEFNPSTFSRLKSNIEPNFDEDFLLINAALCGGSRPIPASDRRSGTSDDIYSGDAGEESITVEGLTFDEIYARGFDGEIIDICKIDVEGAEFEVFENSGCESIAKCRNLIMEIHHSPERRRGEIIEKVAQLGFEELNGDNKRGENQHYVHFFRNTRG